MRRIAIIFWTLLLCGFIPFSCKKSSSGGCGDPDDYPKTFTIRSMEIQSVSVKDLAPLDTGLYYAAKDIAKRLYVKDAEFFVKRHASFFFISEALACSPVEAQATHHISRIEIINQTENLVIDSQSIQKGADLAAYFNIKVNDRGVFLPISDFIIQEYKLRHSDSYLLQFSKAPQTETRLRFSFTITMNDGAQFAFNNEQFNIR